MHDLRVSIRRLRALFRAASLIEPRIGRPETAGHLRALMSRLSRLRDLQVQQALLEPMLSDHPCLASFRQQLESLESTASSILARQLLSFSRGKIAQEVSSICQCLGRVPAGSRAELKALGRLSGRLARWHQRLLALRSGIDPSDPATIHRLRVAFKKYRYLVEPLAALSKNSLPNIMSRMHDFQGAMGDIQDLALLVHNLRSWAAKSGCRHEADPAIRLLAARLEEKINAFLGLAPEMDSYVFQLTVRG